MNIAQIWEKSTLMFLSKAGVQSELINVPPYTLSALTIRANQSVPKKKRKVVCVHGLGSSASAYGALLPYLAEYWNEVWAPSAPGHGTSPPLPKYHYDTLEDSSSPPRFQALIYQAWEHCLLELSKDHPVDLLGISLGGAVAIRFAAKFPDHVSTLMLCSPAGALLDQSDIDHLHTVFRMDYPTDGLRFLKILYHQVPWWGPLLSPLIWLNLRRPEAQNLIKQLKPGDGLKPNEFSALTAPTLLIWGKRERVLPPTSLENLLKYAPEKLSLVQPNHFSHTPQKECPKELSQYLISFQERVELSQEQAT